MASFPQHFGCQVRIGSTERFGHSFSLHSLFRQAKVREKRMSLIIQDNIIRFQIPEDDVLPMQFFQRQQNLTRIDLRLLFVEFLLELEVFCEVAARAVVEDHEEFLLRLEGVVQAHNEGVPLDGEDVALCQGVAREVVTQDLGLCQHFHREKGTGGNLLD